MLAPEHGDVRAALAKVIGDGEQGAAAAGRLCVACLPILQVDAAAISVIDGGTSRGTFGASDESARVLDELQFTYGEGPCLEAARAMQPVLVPDLAAQDEPRWPAFAEAAGRAGIRAVFALPVKIGSVGIGALDLFRYAAGPLSAGQLGVAVLVAEAAAATLLDLAGHADEETAFPHPEEPSSQLTSWSRIEVYQATGMIMAQLHVPSSEALVRLRAYAYAHDLSARAVARLVVSRQLRLEP